MRIKDENLRIKNFQTKSYTWSQRSPQVRLAFGLLANIEQIAGLVIRYLVDLL